MPIRKRTKVERNEGVEIEKGEGIGTKHCPFCDNEIRIKAIKCQYCGEWLVDRIENPFIYKRDKVGEKDDEGEDGSVSNETEYSKKKKRNLYIIIILIILFLILLTFLISKFNSDTGDENFERIENIDDEIGNNNIEIENISTLVDDDISQSIEDFFDADGSNQLNEDIEEKETVVHIILDNETPPDKPDLEIQTSNSNYKK